MTRTIAIAGATGFVGRALLSALAKGDDRLVGLTRGDSVSLSDGEAETLRDVEWRRVDLFSLLECERALEGATHAVYLVHSMAPSARLTQASFDDLDLLLADNFARAARHAGVEHIVYLSGILPRDEDPSELSDHLRSRAEVEEALRSTGVPVTCVRAGLVLGPGGSSATMMTRLVERLPAMLCPAWTASASRPIDRRDLVPVLTGVIGATHLDRALDVGGPEALSYRELMARTAAVQGRRRLMVPTRLFSPGLSVLWVSLVTGSSRDLVAPLVESLRHCMLPEDDAWQREHAPPRHGLDDSLRRVVEGEDPERPHRIPAVIVRERPVAPRNTVRSVQRLPNPGGLTAADAADAYTRWLPKYMRPFLRVDSEPSEVRFRLAGLSRPLLVLTRAPDRSQSSRPLFYVTGGLLARPDLAPTGRLEFRSVRDGRSIVSAIHDFVPRLPWYLYNATQAVVHLFVMRAFGRWLGRRRVAQSRSSKKSSSGSMPSGYP